MDLIAVKERITGLRGDMNKREFAESVGINASYLSQIENPEDSQKPSIEALFSISEACSVSIDYILTGRDYTSAGMADNQSFVGAYDIRPLETPLAKRMFRDVKHLVGGIYKFDKHTVGQNKLLRDLQGSSSAISTDFQVSQEVKRLQSEPALQT